MAETALAFAEGQADDLRPRAAARRGMEPPRPARGRSRDRGRRAMRRRGVRRSQPDPHRGGARSLRPRARRRRRHRPSSVRGHARSAMKLGLIDEEARCTATLAARYAYGGRSRRPPNARPTTFSSSPNARHPRRRGRRLADARGRPPNARRAGERARCAPQRGHVPPARPGSASARP